MGVVLALPAERPLMRGQRLHDQVDRLPEALDIADRVSVSRYHLAVARFDEADFKPTARNDVGSRIFLGHPHWVGADRDQCPKAQNADLFDLAGENAEDHRARPIKAVDPGMVLDRDHVDPELIAQQVLVEAFLEQVGGDLWVTISVGEARAHRICPIEYVLRHKRVDVFAMIPGLHLGSPDYSARKAAT